MKKLLVILAFGAFVACNDTPAPEEPIETPVETPMETPADTSLNSTDTTGLSADTTAAQ